MLGRITNGRLRSRFFCSGTGSRVTYFRDWFGCLAGPRWTLRLADPLDWSLASWFSFLRMRKRNKSILDSWVSC
jgi:hypothetical protein